MFLNPSFKIIANVARPIVSTKKKKLYTNKDFKSSGIGSLYEKYFLILNGLKTSLILKFSLQNSLKIFESLFSIWYKRLPIYGNLK